MKFSKVELPSNKRFGFFFTTVFILLAVYFFYHENWVAVLMFCSTGAIFFSVSILKADILLPLNQLWMMFGALIGKLVSPLVLGTIFFGIFLPYAVLMRISGRDELRLRLKKEASYWNSRSEPLQVNSFKNQF